MVEDLLQCKHRRRDFVEAHESNEERHAVYICKDCGEIQVSAFRDGVLFKLNFHINLERQVMMINKWPTWILEDETA